MQILQRKELIHHPEHRKTDLNKRLTIGILGCTAGAGVTHLAITLSNLCHSKLHKKLHC